VLTATALVAFAANSVLCRIALREDTVDAATFSIIRVLSGAVMLLIATGRGQRQVMPIAGSWTGAVVLTLYAVPFAFAYTELSAGTGALILFGCVQVTMLAAALRSGERPRAAQWVGAVLALAGLVSLVFPGLTAPPPSAAFLMTIAGVAWGVYSLRGRVASNPLSQTTGNFVRAVPLVVVASVLVLPRAHVEARGVALSVASGALASGLGYVAWYAALRGLSSLQGAVVQLVVPLLAAAAGVVLLSETVSLRLVLSTVLVLGGIAMAIVGGRLSMPSADESAA
jgi:drug/metabolite transporter (DMT)-like permease